MTSRPLRILILDLDDQLRLEDLAEHLPGGRNQLKALQASEHGGPTVMRRGTEATPVDWEAAAACVSRMVATARKDDEGGPQVEYWIAGRAPLPVFVHLALEISAWAAPPTLVNRRKDGFWDVISLAAATPQPVAEGVPFFREPEGFGTPSEATGRVALFVSTLGEPANREELRRFIRSREEEVAGIVEVRTEGFSYLTGINASQAAEELARAVSRIPGAFPHASGIAAFVAGPATLAFIVGRAVNQNMIEDVWVPNFEGGEYVPALSLPWRRRGPALRRSDADTAARRGVLQELRAGIAEMTQSLSASHFMPILAPARAEAVVRNLRTLA